MFEITGSAPCAFQIAFVFEIAVSHYKRQGRRRCATARPVNNLSRSLELTGKTAIGILKRQNPVEHRLHLRLPLRVSVAKTALCIEIVQDSENTLRLAADAHHISLPAAFHMHRFTEIPFGGKPVFKRAFKNGIRLLNQILVGLFAAMLQRIVGIE